MQEMFKIGGSVQGRKRHGRQGRSGRRGSKHAGNAGKRRYWRRKRCVRQWQRAKHSSERITHGPTANTRAAYSWRSSKGLLIRCVPAGVCKKPRSKRPRRQRLRLLLQRQERPQMMQNAASASPVVRWCNSKTSASRGTGFTQPVPAPGVIIAA